jgi:hypothetical protein
MQTLEVTAIVAAAVNWIAVPSGERFLPRRNRCSLTRIDRQKRVNFGDFLAI